MFLSKTILLFIQTWLSSINFLIQLYMILSNTLENNVSTDIGIYFVIWLGSPTFMMGTILASFSHLQKIHSVNDLLIK